MTTPHRLVLPPFHDSPAATLIREMIDQNEISQRHLAKQCGYARPNVISMIKRGEMKVPVYKAPILARSLNISLSLLAAKCEASYPDHEGWLGAMELHRKLVEEAAR